MAVTERHTRSELDAAAEALGAYHS